MQSTISVNSKPECYGFECLGECSGTKEFHSQGFVGKGESNDFFPEPSTQNQGFVNLFGSVVHMEMSDFHLERLFNCARHRLCILDSLARSSQRNGACSKSSNSGSSYIVPSSLRRELREFYHFLRNLISTESHQSEHAWVVEELLPTITQGLSLLRRQLGWLVCLPSLDLNVTPRMETQSENTNTAAFHLFHAHLELRWLHTSIFWIIYKSPLSLVEFESYSNIKSFIHNCIRDLMAMSLLRFSKLKEEQIWHKSFYNCVCVKELWFLLKSLFEKLEGSSRQSFWKPLNNILEEIVSGEEGSFNLGEWSLEAPSKLGSRDPTVVSLWALRHLADLFVSHSALSHNCVGTGIEDNYDALKRILSVLADSFVSRTESQLRIILSFVKKIVTEIWVPKTEPVMMLWDCFSRNLDSAFQPSGSAASFYSVPFESPQDIFNHVESIIKGKPAKGSALNSYESFLSLLGTCLTVNPSLWKSKMRGRFYSKLSVKKVEGLSEMGLYHLTQLFLTIGVENDIEDIRKQFQSLFLFRDVDDRKNIMILKAHLSLIFLCCRRNLTLSEVLPPVVRFVDACVEKEKFDLPRKFVESMSDLMAKHLAPLDHNTFVGKWVSKYLHHYHPDSGKKLLSILLIIMERLERSLELNGGIIEECMEAQILSLWENVLPYVLKQMDGSLTSLPIAELAISFTFLSIYLADGPPAFRHKAYTFQNLVDQFLMMESTSLVNITIIRRYIFLFLSHNKAKVILEDEGLQHTFIKAWVRSCAMNSEITNNEDKRLSELIFEQTSVIQNITNSSSSNMKQIATSQDPLCSLFELFSAKMKEIKNTVLYRKTVSSVLQPLERLACLFQQHLFHKPKDDNVKTEKRTAKELPKDIVVRGYNVLARAISDCGGVIYQRGMNTSLLPQLVSNSLLAPAVYDPSFRLPHTVNEALRKCLLSFMRGLLTLDPGKDPCINRYVVDIVKIYLPRMVLEHSFGTNPFVQIWDEPQHWEAAKTILQIMCNVFMQVDKSTNFPHKHYVQCLQVLIEIVKSNSSDEFTLPIIIKHALPCILEVMGKVITDIGARAKYKESTERTLYQIFTAEAFVSHSNVRDECNSALLILAKRYLMQNIDIFKRILLLLLRKQEFHCILENFLPSLKEYIESKKKEGSNVDKQQNLCDSLLKALKTT